MTKTFASDGDYTVPSTNGGDVRHLPFLNRGDETSYIIERFVEQELASFSTPALGTQATEQHGGNSAAGDALYLIDESPLDPAGVGKGMAMVSRLWAPELADYVRYGRIAFNLPDFRGLSYDPGSGAVEPTYNEGQRSLEIPLGGDLSLTSSERWFTAGSWTFQSSASIAYDASEATIDAAVQGELSGSTVVDTLLQDQRLFLRFRYVDLFWPIEAADFDLSSLTGSAEISVSDPYYSLGAYQQDVTIYPSEATYNTTGAHGLTTGDDGYLKNGTGFSEFVEVTVVDSDSFTVVNSLAMAQQATLNTFSGAGFYYVRAKSIPCRWIYQHYMPGVTAGITTPADIPPLDVRDYDFGLYKAIVDRDESVYISVGDLEQPYPGLYVRIAIQIDISSLFD